MISDKEKCAFWNCRVINETIDGKIKEIINISADIGIMSLVVRDPSDDLIELIHAKNIKAYIDFSCFVGEKYWENYEYARPVGPDKKPIVKHDWYHGVNPACEIVRQELLDKFERAISKKGIDGVWLDFIRWPCHWEVYEPKLIQTSFDDYTVNRFFSDTGIEKQGEKPAAEWILKYKFSEWFDWKSSMITSWVGSAWDIKNRVAPNITLGLFGVPWLSSEFDGALESVICQDYHALSEYIDVFSPMAYHKMCNRPVSWILESISEIKKITKKDVLPVLQCTDVPTKLSRDEFAKALTQTSGDKNSNGVMIYELDTLVRSDKLSAMKVLSYY